jgi:hypothetical protein
MAAARYRHAADDGASNLLLGNGNLLVMLGRCAGRHRKCKHGNRNNGSNCFHNDPSLF